MLNITQSWLEGTCDTAYSDIEKAINEPSINHHSPYVHLVLIHQKDLQET